MRTRCVIWKGTQGGGSAGDRYGVECHDGKQEFAHRAAYRRFKGRIRPEYQIHHLCGVKLCVNAEHLEAVTHQEICRRAWEGRPRATHCPSGHELAGRNRTAAGKCRICYNAQAKARYAARKDGPVRGYVSGSA